MIEAPVDHQELCDSLARGEASSGIVGGDHGDEAALSGVVAFDLVVVATDHDAIDDALIAA